MNACTYALAQTDEQPEDIMPPAPSVRYVGHKNSWDKVLIVQTSKSPHTKLSAEWSCGLVLSSYLIPLVVNLTGVTLNLEQVANLLLAHPLPSAGKKWVVVYMEWSVWGTLTVMVVCLYAALLVWIVHFVLPWQSADAVCCHCWDCKEACHWLSLSHVVKTVELSSVTGVCFL